MHVFMMDVLKLLLQGVNVEMAYLHIKKYSSTYDFNEKRMDFENTKSARNHGKGRPIR